ncbi:MAG: choice-of-anchor I family protein [Flavobacteriales bacterium]|nr:choice-of-anchor I family protein [Flavobacteriales bacterium]
MNLNNFLTLLLFIVTNLSYSQYSSTLLGRYTDGRDGACEISAYDSSTVQLFITNSESDSIDIVSIQNPQAPLLVGGIDVTLYGGGVNSLVNIGNGHIAAAIEDTNAQAPGKVVFFDMNGLYINEVTVGVLPDMITVTEDKSKVIVANEGEPNDDYDIDPLGSVSVIDISAGIAGVTQADVTTIDFTSYNGQESVLRAQGALIFGKKQEKTFNSTLLGRYTDGRDGACEISAYDSSTVQLFVTNSESDSIDIVSIQNPQVPVLVGGVDVTLYGGGVNSLVNIGDGHFAAAIEDTNAQAPGKVVFFDMNGLYINEVTVGVLPDMITVTKDKSKVIVANEGEPNDDYDVDPLGSVSVIDISAGIAGVTQADVSTIDFTSYNGQESVLRAQGALIFGKQSVKTPTDLFFSEYSEGSSNNKYLEIYNGTGSSVDLSNYVIMQNSNGGPWDEYTDVLSGTLADGDVYVIANSSASPSILAEADLTGSGICFFNGDDARALIKVIGSDTTICDLIGDFPNDPGSGWDLAGVTNGTQNHTLVRKNWVNKGNDSWSISAGTDSLNSEWIVYPQDSIVSLGSHSFIINDSLSSVNTKHSTVAEDLEPEYVTTDESSATAYVVCQENNAIAIIDLTTLTLDTIVGLGFKDFNLPGNGFDASNQDNGINIQNWPVKGAYQPDAIDYYSVNNTSYLVTANEGDARDYDGYSAEVRMDDLTFDPTAFPNAATLQTNDNLGRLKTFTEDVIGDTDGDGDVDELYAYGARSFSIWDENGNLVWDSGDDFEQYIAANHPTFFNCNDGLASEMDDRSDDKGPEPEAVTVGQIGNSYYAFIGLERQGGVMVYDVTDPTNPSFVNFIQTYDTTSGTMTDIAPEGLVFVPANESHNGENLLIVSSEVSGTVAIYELQDCISSIAVTDSSCNSYLWNNVVYSNSGVYSDTLSNSFGCDSIITLDLTIFNISAAIDTISGNLVASGGVNYLWNTGETASSITPDTNGLYTVIVTDINGCTDTVSFNVTFISNTGIVGLNNNFRLYPNPNNGQFVIECQEKIKSIILYNIQGQIVRSFTRINSKQFTINESFNEKGIFFVNISTQDKSFIEKVVINK